MTNQVRTGPRIGIYGGTFDPVHLGHLRAAKAFLELCALDRLYVIPTGITPHKQNRQGDDPAARLAMLRIAFSDPAWADPRITVSDFEQRQGGKSYTILTLEHFRKESPNLFLLCGTDMFLTLDRWFRGPEILSLVTAVCLQREENDPAAKERIEKQAEFYRTVYAAEVLLPSYEPYALSSTEVRAAFADGRPADAMLTEGVRAYIAAHGLYRPSVPESPDLPERK